MKLYKFSLEQKLNRVNMWLIVWDKINENYNISEFDNVVNQVSKSFLNRTSNNTLYMDVYSHKF